MRLLSTGLLVICFLRDTSGQIGGAFDCPQPWLAQGDKCYKFELFQDTLQGAVEGCARDGAALVSINNRDEHDFIVDWLQMNALQNRKWYTSGKRVEGEDSQFQWDGDGTRVEGTQFWLDEDARKMPGDKILYATRGQVWGWMIGESQSVNQEKLRPYICEISKAEIFRIVEEDRGFEYGTLETDSTKFEMGPHFVTQPVDVIYDKNGLYNYLTVECVGDGTPKPGYEWYKTRERKRVLVDPLGDNRFTITNGKMTMNDPDDAEGDNGEYQCLTKNTFGGILSNTIIISFGYLNDFPKSPRDPVRQRAYQGTGIECNPPTHGYSRLYYQWMKDGEFVYTDRKPYIFNSLNGKLYFSSVTKDDQGFYQCIITVPETKYSHQGGKSSQPIELIVLEGLGTPSDPQIESGFPAVFPSSPKLGDNVTIECFARGYATEIDGMQYSWSKINGVLPDNAQQRDSNRVLYIPNIQLINSGEYQCTVRQARQSGQDSEKVTLAVEAEPYFTIPLKNQHIDLGSDLTWQCIADGNPAVRYSWFRNGNELVQDELSAQDIARYTISNNVLTIRNADPERDVGMYQCAATNSHGTRYSSAQLRILTFAPSFVKYPVQDRIYGTLKGNVTIICQPEAAPAPTKIWHKDNRPMQPSENLFDRVHMLPNGNLRLTNLRDSDAGTYKCNAENNMGKAESEGTLIILPTTTISQYPLDTVVMVNKTAFFHCEASFNPALDITYDWYHNDYHIQFIKIRFIGDYPHIEKEEYFERGRGINRGGLYIRHVQYFHQGEYTCIAKSTQSTIKRDAKLDVIGPPFPPVGVTLDQVTATSGRVKWKMGNPTISNNGRAITSYIVERKHKLENVWRRAKGQITDEEMRNKETTVIGLTPASTYTFRVKAENILGIGDPSNPSDSVTTMDAPPVTAPKWVGRCVNKVGTLCIAWTPVPLAERNGEGFGYIVQFQKSYFIDEEWTVVNITDPEATHYVATVGRKNFYTEYNVQVRTRNKMGEGPVTRDSQATIHSAMDMPAAQPTQLRIWQHNATALLVEWDMVENTVEQMKGKLMGYRINYWRECCETENMAIFNQVLGQTDHGMIIGLYPDTKYWVNVQVYNEAGYGAKNDPLIQETLRASPLEAPQEVKVFVQGSRSVRVTWRGVSTGIQEEPLEGYIIRFWQQSENRYMSHDVDARKKTNFVVKNLQKNTMYELRVLGYSRGGDGLMSSPIIQFILGDKCYVREDSPDREYVYKCRGETGAASSAHVSIGVLVITAILQQMVTR